CLYIFLFPPRRSADLLIGVVIGGKSGRGTQTNVEGKFTLTATEGELLTFSYIGYNTIQLPAKAIMNVVLEENAVMLEAVQVVDVDRKSTRLNSSHVKI